MRPLNLILLYSSSNRYSMNTLLGAIENMAPEHLNVRLATNEKEINNEISSLKSGEMAVIAISFFTEQKEKIKEMVQWLKPNATGKILLIAGGPHTSANPEEVLKYGFDYAVTGEGEKTFPDLLLAIKRGDQPASRILTTSEKINLDDYPSFSKKYLRFGPIEITRGCPCACKFCQTSFLFGCQPRHRGIHRIIEQVKEMAKLGLDDIRFLSPDALSYGSYDKKTDLKAVEEMLRAVKKEMNPNGRIFFGTFPSEIRPESVSEDALLLLKKYVHNTRLTIGAQSGSEKLLMAVNRGHGIKEIENAVNLCIKAGFTPVLDFIFGLPGEDDADIDATIAFIEKISRLGAVIHTHSFTPLPGTPLAGEKLGEIPARLRIRIKHLENDKLAFGKWEKKILKETKKIRLER